MVLYGFSHSSAFLGHNLGTSWWKHEGRQDTKKNRSMLATILIIAGFVLNALQAYVADFSSRFAKRVQSCADRLGLIEMDYGLPYPDYDPDIPDDQRDTVASRNTVFRFWHLAVLAWH